MLNAESTVILLHPERWRFISSFLPQTVMDTPVELVPDVAAKAFREALTFVPNHAALNLNLIQVRLSQGVGKPGTEEWIHECKSCIKALSALPDGHRQYKRFRTLKAKVEALSDDS